MESLSVYILVVSLGSRQWHDDLFDESSAMFKAEASRIVHEVDKLYKDEVTYKNTTVTRMILGSVRATLMLEFLPSETDAIEKLEVAVKRGHIGTISTEPSNFKLQQMGRCDGCSPYSHCLRNISGHSDCKCQEGFEGDGHLCIDIDECQNLNGGCSQRCLNTIGSYLCRCNFAFILGNDHKSCAPNPAYGKTFCPAEFVQGVSWVDTVTGRTLIKMCPNNPSQGNAIRICGDGGTWNKPDLSQCIISELHQINDEVSGLNFSSTTWSTLKRVLRSIARETFPKLSVLYGGDILETKRLLRSLLYYVKDKIGSQTLEESGIILNLLNSVVNNIFDESNHNVWHGIPKPMVVVSEYLELIDNIAKIMSDHMIIMMKAESIKRPESVSTFNLSSFGSAINLDIRTVEMRSFPRVKYNIYDSQRNSYKVTYPTDLFQQEVKALIEDQGLYHNIGCWADYDLYAAGISLETEHPLLMDHFLRRADKIEKCGIAADSFNYNVFAIQDGGMCASGPNFHRKYDERGLANNCAYGLGGVFANSVYEIKKFYTGILTASYPYIGNLLESLSPSILPPSTSRIRAAGSVVSTKILRERLNGEILNTPIDITFFDKPNVSGIMCAQVIRRNETFQISIDHCITLLLEGTVQCNCSTLSRQILVYNYSIIKTQPKEEANNYYKELSYTSYAITCFSFLLTILVYYCARMDTIPIVFQVNVTSVLICSESIFIFGIGSTWTLEKTICKWLTFIFHFMLTSLFAWLLAQSLYAYHTLSDIVSISYKSRMTFYHLLGYGCPCVVCLVSLAAFYDSYGTTMEKCWLKDTLLFALFIPPIGVLILLNIVILGAALCMYFSPRTSLNFPDQKSEEMEADELHYVRNSIYTSAILLPVFVATWVFAVLRMHYSDDLFKYLFLALNVLQGILYCILHCSLTKYQSRKKSMEFDDAELDDQVVDLQEMNQVNSLNIFKMRAAKHEFNNHGFENSSPNLLKATAYNGNNFSADSRRSIPTEVMYEMEQQFYTKKTEERSR